MLGLFTSLAFAAILIVAWRVHSLLTRTILGCWGVVMVILIALQISDNVNFSPLRGDQFTVLDYAVAAGLGALIGLIARGANGLLPDSDPLAPKPAPAPVTEAASSAPHVFDAMAAGTLGMQAEMPPARGSLL